MHEHTRASEPKMPATELGTLERIDVKDAWASEPGDFTPWLARDENLALLGEALDLDLELEATESNIGPFRADILCKDMTTGYWVLIENQLERTDHTHLGQLLTYAAGLQAVTIIWIAAPFNDQHRAALDWLNEITDDRFQFFGLEIELWRIGNSLAAPKFNIVVKPNDWSRSVSAAAKTVERIASSSIRQTYYDYWSEFAERLGPRRTVSPKKPQAESWLGFSAGRANFIIYLTISARKKRLRAYLSLLGPDSKAHFHLLKRDADTIEQEMGEPVEWLEHRQQIESHIGVHLDGTNPVDQSDWPRQHAWLCEKLEKLRAVFRERVKELDASDWPENEAT